jgi:hypothetical protein
MAKILELTVKVSVMAAAFQGLKTAGGARRGGLHTLVSDLCVYLET